MFALASRSLIQTTGGTIFSISVLTSGPALITYWLIQNKGPNALGVLIAILSAAILASFHVPMVVWLGAEAALLASVVLHMMWSDAWLALPLITGGSGGLFWPNVDRGVALLCLSGAVCLAAGIELIGNTGRTRFRAAVLIHSPKQCAAFGVNRRRTILLAYVMFGATVGAVGSAVVNWIGCLSLDSIGMSFGTAVLLIALATAQHSFLQVVGVCGVQALLRTVIRTEFSASPLASHCLDVALPLVLLFSTVMRRNIQSEANVYNHEQKSISQR